MKYHTSCWLAVEADTCGVLACGLDYDETLTSARETIWEANQETDLMPADEPCWRPRILMYPATFEVLLADQAPTDDYAWTIDDGVAVMIWEVKHD